MNAERLVALAWLIFGAGIAYTSLEHGLGEKGEPGSGFMTFIAGVFICGMAITIYVQTFLDKEMAKATFASRWEGTNWMRAVMIVLLTLGFILLMGVLGYFVTSILLLVIIMRFLEKLTWTKSIVIPILTVAATYTLFSSMLDMNMPRGLIGLW